jgi:subtilisin family serine protease
MRTAAFLTLLPLALAAPAKRSEPAPIHRARDVELIEGKYIVKLKDEISISSLDDSLSTFSQDAEHVYDVEGFKGFSAALDESGLESLQNHPDVEFIEQDAVINLNAYVTQSGATWGISRISHREGTSGYTYDNSAGAGTCAYIVDTGIYTAHSDFGGRAVWAANFVDSANSDGNGHGTHVAGTVGGTTYGVAKATTLYAVKVLSASGSGSTSGVVAGMNYVVSNAPSRSCPSGVVVNMSLGGGFSSAINSAAAAITNAGHFLAVAAGNSAANAANYSPASAPSAATVGATTSSDAVASYSNYGALVDIFAPGSAITSTYIGGTSATASLSGTSMASPHIAGLGAYLLALEGARSPAALISRIQALATPNTITGVPSGTVNLLAFNGNPSG